MAPTPSVSINLKASDELTPALKKFSASLEGLGKVSKAGGGLMNSLSKDFEKHRAAVKASIAPVQKLAEAHQAQMTAIGSVAEAARNAAGRTSRIPNESLRGRTASSTPISGAAATPRSMRPFSATRALRGRASTLSSNQTPSPPGRTRIFSATSATITISPPPGRRSISTGAMRRVATTPTTPCDGSTRASTPSTSTTPPARGPSTRPSTAPPGLPSSGR